MQAVHATISLPFLAPPLKNVQIIALLNEQ